MPFLTMWLGPHRRRRILANDLTDDQPVEQPADRRKVLLDRRRAVDVRQHLDIGRDMMRADFAELGEILHLEPGEELAHGDAIGGARVRVADVRGEEIDEAQPGALAGVGDQCRSPVAGSMMVSAVLLPGLPSGSSMSFIVSPPNYYPRS